jgi:hypothetical protein
MAYGENKGRFREIRVGRFDPNMGAEAVPVKWADSEKVSGGRGPTAKEVQSPGENCNPASADELPLLYLKAYS